MSDLAVFDLGVKSQRAGGVEIASLTSIRGIAALWVVLLHASALVFGVLPEAAFLRPFAEAGHFAVPMFFILSGYVLGLRYGSRLAWPTAGTVLRFWWLRLGRLYPVHLTTLLLSLGLVARNGWPADEGHSPVSFLANCLLMQAWGSRFVLSWNYPAWSISSEWFAYLLFPAIASALAGQSRRGAAVIAIAACCSSILVYLFRGQVKFEGLAVVLPTFVGGVCLAIACPPGASSARPWPWSALGLSMAVAIPFAVRPGPSQVALYLALFFALVGYLGAVGNHSAAFWRSRPVLYLGEISYSLYMIHAIVITLTTKLIRFEALRSQTRSTRIAVLLVCLMTILGAASAMYHGIERPMRNLSRRGRPAAPVETSSLVP